jgi:hypothetical protein
VERVLACIGHAERCQALAETAPTEIQKARFLRLAQILLEFADTRRQILIIEGTDKQYDGAVRWVAGDWINAPECQE